MTYETTADAPTGSTPDHGHRFRSTDRSRFAFFGSEGGLERADVSEIMSPAALPPTVLEAFDPMELMAGARVEALFSHSGEQGLSLVRVNFAPHYMLPRHTHDADCLYYVVSGSVVLGSRVVGPGAGFYVPAGAPYGYQAGPEGVELLEFRDATTFDIDVVEDNPARWRTMIDNARAHKENWATF